MGRLRTRIQETVHADHLTYTFNCTTVYAMLTNLKSRFAPADYARKQELTIEWRKQCSQPKRGTEIEPWL
jgi:hypothetical protein